MRLESSYRMLILAGAVPFAAGAVLTLAGVTELPWLGALERVVLSYGLGIVSFLTGIHWATRLYRPEACPLDLFVISNAIFLAVWFGYLASLPIVSVIVQCAAFVALFAIDLRLARAGLISGHYLRFRAIATMIAVLSLLAFL